MAKIKLSELTELTSPSSNTQNTFVLVTDIQSGTPLSRKMSVKTLDTLIDVTQGGANAAFEKANASFNQANAAFTIANAAFVAANTPTASANASFDAANNALVVAQFAFSKANSGSNIATNLEVTGNTTITSNVVVGGNITPTTTLTSNLGNSTNRFHSLYLGPSSLDLDGFVISNYNNEELRISNARKIVLTNGFDVNQQANASFNNANAAFNSANTKVNKAGDTLTGTLYFTGQFPEDQYYVGITDGVEFGLWSNVSVELNYSNINYVIADTTGSKLYHVGDPDIFAEVSVSESGAYISSNTRTWYFNTDGALQFPDNTKQYTAAAPYSYSNAAFNHANAAFVAANAAGGSVIDTYARNHSNSAFDTANSAGVRANNSLDANNGGDVFGTVSFYGNIQQYNATANLNHLHVQQPYIYVNAGGQSPVDGRMNLVFQRGSSYFGVPNAVIAFNETSNTFQMTNGSGVFANIAFEPYTAANLSTELWATSPPLTLLAAIERLANAVIVLNGYNPIP